MYKKIILLLGFILLPSLVQAQLRIFACEPEWAALSMELGGDKVSIYQATSAFQDPHHIEARPSLIAKMRRADLLVCTGVGLEEAWLPLIIRRASNGKVLEGQPGHFMAALQVSRLDIPINVDRKHGDVHPQGNPHVHLDPNRLLKIANDLSKRLVAIDADNKAYYLQRLESFSTKWRSQIANWEKLAKPLQGIDVVVYHKDWLYLFEWLKINVVATIEPKPGITPSAGYLTIMKQQLLQKPAAMVVFARYQNDKASRWLSEKMKYPLVELPYTVGGNKESSSLTKLFDSTIQLLLRALKEKDQKQ